MPKENKTIYVILGLLIHEPLSGYDIKKRITNQIGYFWDAGYGQIYPTLQKLTKEGLVSMKVEAGETRPDRKVYSITDQGKEKLIEWVRRPVAEEIVKYEILLKLSFGNLLPISENIRMIQDFKVRNFQNLKILNQYEENLREVLDNNQDHLFYLLTVLFGKYVYQAYLTWADEAVGMLENLNKQ